MRRLAFVLSIGMAVCGMAQVRADSWPQFRGPNGAGRPDHEHKLPTRIGPDQNVLWKVSVPPGHSSPVIHGERIYLTAVRDKDLLTLALGRKTGKPLWEAKAPYQQLEKIHKIGSYAQSTPVTDGQVIISYFGSSGLLCYDPAGKQLWHRPMGPFKNDLGAGSSPILAGDKVILNQDHDIDSFLLAVDRRTGKTVWRVDRSEFPVSYASPVLWESGGQKQVVVSGSLRVVGYDLETGKEVWTVRGLARAVHMSPSVGPDGTLYVAGWTAGGDAGDRFDVPSFAEMLAQHDANKNGTLELEELPEGPLKQRFSMLDRNKDGHVTQAEYDFLRRVFNLAENRIIAIKPGGKGDVTKTHVVWSQRKYLPVVPSPLFYRGQLYLVKNGGILATLDAKTGQMTRQERLSGGGDYYASPVGGDGKVYVVSQRGSLTVVSAEAEWKELARARFDDEVYATPALVDGRIYLRTMQHLYCFGE
jgi:outer membrane protein assembly factor BamB